MSTFNVGDLVRVVSFAGITNMDELSEGIRPYMGKVSEVVEVRVLAPGHPAVYFIADQMGKRAGCYLRAKELERVPVAHAIEAVLGQVDLCRMGLMTELPNTMVAWHALSIIRRTLRDADDNMGRFMHDMGWEAK